MPRGLPISSEEFDALLAQKDTGDIDVSSFSNQFYRSRNRLLLIAVISLVVWLFVGLTLLFSVPLDSLEAILLFSIGNLIFSLTIVATLAFDAFPGIVVFVGAIVVFLLECVQLGVRLKRIVSVDGCGVSCGFFEYVYFFFGLVFFVFGVSFLLSAWAYWNVTDTWRVQYETLMNLRAIRESSTTSSEARMLMPVSTSQFSSAISMRRRPVASGKTQSDSFNDIEWEMTH